MQLARPRPHNGSCTAQLGGAPTHAPSVEGRPRVASRPRSAPHLRAAATPQRVRCMAPRRHQLTTGSGMSRKWMMAVSSSCTTQPVLRLVHTMEPTVPAGGGGGQRGCGRVLRLVHAVEPTGLAGGGGGRRGCRRAGAPRSPAACVHRLAHPMGPTVRKQACILRPLGRG